MKTLILCIAATLSFHIHSLANAETVSIEINPKKTYQTLEGFGHGNMEQQTPVWYHKYGKAGAEQILDTLYTMDDNGLGLNIYRYPMPAADAPGHDHMKRLPKTANKPFEYEDGKFNWEGHEDVLWMGTGAAQRGAKLWASWYGFPYWLSTSGCSSGSADGKSNNLIAGKEKRFIKHVTDIMQHFRDEWQIEFEWVNPINEPEADWWKTMAPQPGSHVSVEQAIILYNELDKALKASNFDSKIVGYDAAYTNTTQYLDTLLASDVRPKIDVLACHQYITTEQALKAWADCANQYKKSLWMSEWGDWTNTKRTPQSNMTQMINYATKLHESFDVLNANAWIMWEAGFIFDTDETQLTKRKSYWALAHYTRHITPGAKRIQIETKSNKLKSTAWLMKTGKTKQLQLVIVTVNDSDKPYQLQCDLSKFKAPTLSNTWRTSAEENYKTIRATQKNSTITVNTPPKSITTIQVDLK